MSELGGYTFDQLLQALGQVESTNDYGAIGPVTRRGNRAYGRFQVMDFNVPSWTEQYYGTRLTPQEFLASPEAQDAVFRGRMGEYYGQSTGTPEERIRNAGSLWFTGRPYSPETAMLDDTFITNQEYGDRILRALGAPQGADPMTMTPDPEQQPQGFFGRVGQGLGGLFQSFSDAPDSSPTDPFANLSRNQRMMLGFAALRDAAASLQGERGGNFTEALGGFEAARERERLRRQGQAQSLMNLQQALLFAEATGDEATANLYRSLIAQTRAEMGGGAMPQPIPTGGVPVPAPETAAPGTVTPEVEVSPTAEPTTLEGRIADLDRRIAEADAATRDLTERAMTGGITGMDYGPMIDQSRLEAERLRAEREALREEAAQAAQEAGRAETVTLPTIDAALDFLVVGRDPETGEDIINPMLTTRAGRTFSGAIESPEYQEFVGAIETLRTGTLLDALGQAAVGALSEGERQALSAMLGNLDPSDPLGALATLRRMRSIAEAAVAGGSGGSTTGATVNWD